MINLKLFNDVNIPLNNNLTLSGSDIHLWHYFTPYLENNIKTFLQIVSPDEIKRGERFYKADKQKQFIITRGLLRLILGNYLDREPDQLKFNYGPSGKPMIDQANNKTTLNFNVSHSHKLSAFVFTLNKRIGVDVEHIRDIKKLDSIINRFFTKKEKKLISNIDNDKRLDFFFKSWTSKEAYLKATGTGLRKSLDKIELSLNQSEQDRFTRIYDDTAEAEKWLPISIKPYPKYFTTIVIETAIRSVMIQ